jgi:hypothetical protein
LQEGVVEQVERPEQVAEVSDALLQRGAVLLLGGRQLGAADGKGFCLEGELVLTIVAHQDQACLAGQLAGLDCPARLGQPGGAGAADCLAARDAPRAL